jgi:hypothetical protein
LFAAEDLLSSTHRKVPFAVVYYSNGCAPEALRRYCLRLLVREVRASGGELVLVTWYPIQARSCRQVVWPVHESNHHNLYRQILAGIEAASAQTILLAEHDVLYPPGYHTAMAEAAGRTICFNTNVWRLSSSGYFRTRPLRHLLSNCAGPRAAVERAISAKAAEVQRLGTPQRAEPDGCEVFTTLPTVDVRHGQNFTGSRKSADGFYLPTIEHWGSFTRYTRLM